MSKSNFHFIYKTDMMNANKMAESTYTQPLKIYYMIDAAENQDTALTKIVVILHQDV